MDALGRQSLLRGQRSRAAILLWTAGEASVNVGSIVDSFAPSSVFVQPVHDKVIFTGLRRTCLVLGAAGVEAPGIFIRRERSVSSRLSPSGCVRTCFFFWYFCSGFTTYSIRKKCLAIPTSSPGDRHFRFAALSVDLDAIAAAQIPDVPVSALEFQLAVMRRHVWKSSLMSHAERRPISSLGASADWITTAARNQLSHHVSATPLTEALTLRLLSLCCDSQIVAV